MGYIYYEGIHVRQKCIFYVWRKIKKVFSCWVVFMMCMWWKLLSYFVAVVSMVCMQKSSYIFISVHGNCSRNKFQKLSIHFYCLLFIQIKNSIRKIYLDYILEIERWLASKATSEQKVSEVCVVILYYQINCVVCVCVDIIFCY